jgi:hypothetical protein
MWVLQWYSSYDVLCTTWRRERRSSPHETAQVLGDAVNASSRDGLGGLPHTRPGTQQLRQHPSESGAPGTHLPEQWHRHRSLLHSLHSSSDNARGGAAGKQPRLIPGDHSARFDVGPRDATAAPQCDEVY